jgi:hypothetical protein
MLIRIEFYRKSNNIVIVARNMTDSMLNRVKQIIHDVMSLHIVDVDITDQLSRRLNEQFGGYWQVCNNPLFSYRARYI